MVDPMGLYRRDRLSLGIQLDIPVITILVSADPGCIYAALFVDPILPLHRIPAAVQLGLI